MGRWGEGFFEGDDDLDISYYISQDAGIELYHYEVEQNPELDFGGKGLEATRDHLNNVVLSQLFRQYSTQKDFHYGTATKELSLTFLAALAMRVGATIQPECMEILHELYKTIPVSPKYSLPLFDSGFRGPMERQFEIALTHYKNDGTPHNFFAPRCALLGCDKSDADLLDGQKLMKCGKCKERRECQTGDWKSHKKVCETPEERHAALKGAGGFMSLNV
ncbi:hypothetical protein D0Z07_8420 [Hyphodiscus hymeniophilus]|uniref:Suppressor of anucleate metulae protein B n=1 Tax=Hyphodiscus hymeniophilus TaxID=353542 RepID=A0A9P6VEE9_9HELO|nr:hypothetical protein D0Z07_8420 [Hyphodiscus hymeniophilus]